ncbi:hypothetical protein Tco_0508030 [Tanacetum coccineum]
MEHGLESRLEEEKNGLWIKSFVFNGFSENVGDIVDGRDFFDRDMSFLDIVSKKVVTNFDVFKIRECCKQVFFAKRQSPSIFVAHDQDVIESNVVVDKSLFHP